ncbi:MAG: 2Fe-2S iron-sulfur cluster-binding protein [Armatimonadota bacterium]
MPDDQVTFTLDGKEVTCQKGEMLLHVARREGVYIPTLCSHGALPEYGACRVCVVEVIRRGWPRVTASCTYPVREAIEVKTHSERAERARGVNIELLLARCPGNEALQDFARRHGVEATRFKPREEPTDCILCGLCVRACAQACDGEAVIGFYGRGGYRDVGSPFLKDLDLCSGCGSCAAVCPTGAIRIEDEGGERYVRFWNTRVKLAQCTECGKYFAPGRLLSQVREKVPAVEDRLLALCPECRPRVYARRMFVGVAKPEGEG